MVLVSGVWTYRGILILFVFGVEDFMVLPGDLEESLTLHVSSCYFHNAHTDEEHDLISLLNFGYLDYYSFVNYLSPVGSSHLISPSLNKNTINHPHYLHASISTYLPHSISTATILVTLILMRSTIRYL